MSSIEIEKNNCLRDAFDWRIMKIYRTLIGQKFIVDKFYGPFVPYIYDDYYKSKKKILIVGQQTNGWVELKEAVNKRLLFDHLSLLSRDFKNGEKYKGTPFWNFSHLFNSKINDNNSLKFVWTNLIKIEKSNGIPDDKSIFDKLVLPTLPLLYDEINILEPDVILFLTGPEYDDYIKLSLPVDTELTFQKIKDYDLRGFANLKINNIDCYRLYHPNYLRQKQLFDKYLSDLLDIIK